jgi:hypothetical protein
MQHKLPAHLFILCGGVQVVSALALHTLLHALARNLERMRA